MASRKCDRVHKGKLCRNPYAISIEVKRLFNPVEIVKVNLCEDHMDYKEDDLDKWAELKYERIHINEKKTPISPLNIV